MGVSTFPDVSRSSSASSPRFFDLYFSRLTCGPPTPWKRITCAGALGLVTLWGICLYSTWATWGSVTVDCGHEMYVPTVLLEGKMLYRDVWFMYGPVAPYFNSLLFRVFGVHLSVLYWAGALSALGSAFFLYAAGMRLSSGLAGWSAGAVVLLEAFRPTIFSFPLPYSFSAVYGCLTACCFVWLVLRATSSKSWGWMFAAGTAAAVCLLLKLEFGAACYVTLILLLAARGLEQRSWSSLTRDVLAIGPGVLACGVVIGWMVSIRGINFILQENYLSWPTSYFMKVYGKFWLAHTGFTLSASAFAEAAKHTLVFVAFWQGWHLLVSRKRGSGHAILLRTTLLLAAIAYLAIFVPRGDLLRTVFFPEEMVLDVTLGAIIVLLYFWRKLELNRGATVLLLLVFSSLLAFRVLLKMTPWDYAIYYSGPVVFCFLLLLRPLMPPLGGWQHSVLAAELLICFGCVAVPALYTREVVAGTARNVPLRTTRGTIMVTKDLAQQYQAAIQFMRDKNAQGQAVLSIPEDTSLYFLSETHCPTRVLQFTPGVIAPGEMTKATIREMEEKPVRYLLWSNRLFPEYGAPRFGTDFNRALGEYFTTHYRRVGFLVPNRVPLDEWNVSVWERLAEGEGPATAGGKNVLSAYREP